jgi:hypothetical protein
MTRAKKTTYLFYSVGVPRRCPDVGVPHGASFLSYSELMLLRGAGTIRLISRSWPRLVDQVSWLSRSLSAKFCSDTPIILFEDSTHHCIRVRALCFVMTSALRARIRTAASGLRSSIANSPRSLPIWSLISGRGRISAAGGLPAELPWAG